MALETLGKLFSSLARVKIMRLFLLNPEQVFDIADVASRSRVTRTAVRSEIASLVATGLIKPKTFSKELPPSPRRKSKTKRVSGYCLNPNFQYIEHLKNLLIDAEFIRPHDLVQRFRRIGKIKLFIISGVFLGQSESRVDFMIVGDNLRKGALDTAVKTLEAEIGKELCYAVFDTQDFIYRMSMYDKLVRDILDFPHERLIEAPQFSTLSLKNA